MKCYLCISNFLKRPLVFPILLFSSISLHWLLRRAFLSLLAILWNSAFNWVYLSFSPLLFASLLFIAICKASSDSHFGFLHFFYSTIKKNEITPSVATWGLGNYHTKWSKSDRERQIYDIAYIQSLKKWYKWVYLQNRNRLTDLEN